MRFYFLTGLFVCGVMLDFFTFGCSGLSTRYQEDEYERTMFDYDTAMQLSDFNSACKYYDPAVVRRNACLAAYDNLKIVEYEVLDTTVSENKQEVSQIVVAEYHFQDRVVVKKLQFEQRWRYREETKTWLLTSDLPVFE